MHETCCKRDEKNEDGTVIHWIAMCIQSSFFDNLEFCKYKSVPFDYILIYEFRNIRLSVLSAIIIVFF